MKLPSILLVACISCFPCLGQVQTTARKDVPDLDKLGPHQNGGRGGICCHAPHTNPRVELASSHDGLWSPDLGPSYTTSIFAPDDVTTELGSSSQVDMKVPSGIMLCLSCHDGNLAVGAMMAEQAYEPTLAGFPSGYGSGIPMFRDYTLIQSSRHTYLDHPIGPNATLGAVGVANRLVLTTCGADDAPCLVPNIRDREFMEFYQNYGAFNITQQDVENRFYSGGRTTRVVIPKGATDASSAYVICITCHMPHTMSSFSGNVDNSPSGATYSTFWFIAAPYNPDVATAGEWSASSATQFCRQCHFTGPGGANESNGILGIHTRYK